MKELQELLKKEIVKVVFTKADGTEREMFCTLLEAILPVREEGVVSKPRKGVVTVWDVDNNGWRSFKPESVISYEVAE